MRVFIEPGWRICLGRAGLSMASFSVHSLRAGFSQAQPVCATEIKRQVTDAIRMGDQGKVLKLLSELEKLK